MSSISIWAVAVDIPPPPPNSWFLTCPSSFHSGLLSRLPKSMDPQLLEAALLLARQLCPGRSVCRGTGPQQDVDPVPVPAHLRGAAAQARPRRDAGLQRPLDSVVRRGHLLRLDAVRLPVLPRHPRLLPLQRRLGRQRRVLGPQRRAGRLDGGDPRRGRLAVADEDVAEDECHCYLCDWYLVS